ncbi:MAG: ferredoxin--NADP(+) reductase [Archangium gephyra]|uniref:ferredoxin--NADP(+) reductase n=1 Tax=Archangium gephyra TaxID=48 RepID=A0A2W5SN63_9BACT|nr:MAG: ferredoxin--NADP(+) reductase [Archangium gephyra]
MAANFTTEKVLSVRHFSDRLFSLVCTRDGGLRFENGQFVMLGLEVDGRPLVRAYSMASANYEDALEFYSIKLPDGPLTSRLQKVKVGDSVLVGTRAVGTLTVANLKPGKHLWMLATGTGLAPFLAMVKDPETWERFERVTVVHGVRHVADLSFSAFFEHTLPGHEYLGEVVRAKLTYHPTVTREPFRNQGRITGLLRARPLSPATDRVVICGSEAMIKETSAMLDGFGFQEGDSHERGEYLIEKAFVTR